MYHLPERPLDNFERKGDRAEGTTEVKRGGSINPGNGCYATKKEKRTLEDNSRRVQKGSL